MAIPTGMQRVLEERNLYRLVKNNGIGVCAQCRGAFEKDPERYSRTDCCCRRMLDSQPDFQAQECRLAELIRKHGHLVLFLPKFHPELNRTPNFIQHIFLEIERPIAPPLTGCIYVHSDRAWLVGYQGVLPQELYIQVGYLDDSD